MKSILLAAAALLVAAPAQAVDYHWRACTFNGAADACDLAGSRHSATLSFRKDGKQISVEKVGMDHECGDGNADACSKALITDTNGRTTWDSYRVSTRRSCLWLRSSRGNRYAILY